MKRPTTESPDHEYLGDGAYVSHDGFGIWLAANDHNNKVVYLEPHAVEKLLEYLKRIGVL